ncbi:MAG TPA: acyl-CoA dehydrogenase N-terminal domain-containing protein, partial [Rhodocyclaceae bacterium]|nr:acyl-CoA dehydrogenase N-terminal domain-containing protein [Rhodocyclaceae bacterium]
MSEYRAPLQEIRFVLRELASLEQIATLPGCEEATPDVVDAVLDEAAKFAHEVLSPLNVVGDREGARWQDKTVVTAPGFADAYRQFVDNGWNGLACDPDFGGQGLPTL